MTYAFLACLIAKTIKMERDLSARDVRRCISVWHADVWLYLAAGHPFFYFFIIRVYEPLRFNTDDSVVPQLKVLNL